MVYYLKKITFPLTCFLSRFLYNVYTYLVYLIFWKCLGNHNRHISAQHLSDLMAINCKILKLTSFFLHLHRNDAISL